MTDLAEGVVPLRKLARNVPHGFKGEKLLDTLAAKQVPFMRATWYIKIVGMNEMVSFSCLAKVVLFTFHI
jgi:Transcription mediator complex subunit Med12